MMRINIADLMGVRVPCTGTLEKVRKRLLNAENFPLVCVCIFSFISKTFSSLNLCINLRDLFLPEIYVFCIKYFEQKNKSKICFSLPSPWLSSSRCRSYYHGTSLWRPPCTSTCLSGKKDSSRKAGAQTQARAELCQAQLIIILIGEGLKEI